jgi:hypothetical protein
MLQKGDRMNLYLEPQVEFFDRAAVPPQIQELLDEWPEIDPGTARLIRAAVMSREPRRLRQAWEMLDARAELARAVQSNRRGAERLESPAARRLSGGR